MCDDLCTYQTPINTDLKCESQGTDLPPSYGCAHPAPQVLSTSLPTGCATDGSPPGCAGSSSSLRRWEWGVGFGEEGGIEAGVAGHVGPSQVVCAPALQAFNEVVVALLECICTGDQVVGLCRLIT
jgi:hypothetical protein